MIAHRGKLWDVRVLLWLRNVAGRTLKAFLPVLAKPDDAFAANWLTEVELNLYAAMDVRDRDHACQVAKAVLQAVPGASVQLVRAALLHDIGKSGTRYQPLERIFVHLYTPRQLTLTPKRKGIYGAWQRNAQHACLGAERIRQAGGCEKVACLVEQHHTPNGDGEAAQLKQVEELF